jgi:hypothetical protein
MEPGRVVAVSMPKATEALPGTSLDFLNQSRVLFSDRQMEALLCARLPTA